MEKKHEGKNGRKNRSNHHPLNCDQTMGKYFSKSITVSLWPSGWQIAKNPLGISSPQTQNNQLLSFQAHVTDWTLERLRTSSRTKY